MLGAILGAIASAPLAATGALTKATGEALKQGAMDGKMPILSAAGETLSLAGDMALGGASNIREGAANVDFGSLNVGANSLASLGAAFSGMTLNPLRSQGVEQAQVQAPAIEAPQQAVSRFDCTMDDVVCPAVPGGGGGRAVGGVSGI